MCRPSYRPSASARFFSAAPRFVVFLTLTLAGLLSASCRKEEDATPWNGPVIELTLQTGDGLLTRSGNPEGTKAGADGTKEGEDKYNENLISWVEFFFYPDGKTDEDATYHLYRSSGKRRSDVMRLELTSEQVNSIIFPSAPDDIRNCTVFALVNYPKTLVEDENDLTGTSLSELENLMVTSDFVSPANHRQSRFVMSGKADLSLRGRAQVVAATGTVNLERYACKMTVGVDVSSEVKVGNEVWKPMLSGMEIYLVNGVSDVTLNGIKEEEPTYFSYRDNALAFAYMDLDDQLHYYFEKEGSYYQTFPTYMYPQRWDYGSTESPRKEPYLKLVVPWMREADPSHGISGTQKQFYYKVIIPDDRRSEFKRSFVRNNWYHIDIRVGILGSETDEATVTVDGWCYIFDWQDKDVVVKNAEIGNARYLSLEQNHYDLHNIDATQFRYTSSHPVALRDIRVTRPYYGTEATGNIQYGGTICAAKAGDPFYAKGDRYLDYNEEQRRDANDGKEWFTDNGTAILFDHALENDYRSRSFDYSPYYISFTLVHADRPDDHIYHKEITLVQYPGIFITFTPNLDPLTGPGGKPLHWGYVYVDGEQYTKAQYDIDSNNNKDSAWAKDHLWRVVYYSSGGRDMYRINVTVLPDGSEFIIGDPRNAKVDNLRPADDYFHTAPAIEGGSRSLQYYYPTEESSRTIDMIAPAYRISTKLSGIEYGGITLQKAKERCASFQENGFPAGRWRLPTRGEIRFISQLSTLGFFEWQFGGDYWSANGAVNVDKGTGVIKDSAVSVALLRCVYDSWYWGDEQLDNLEQFTWGDAER